jgi:hypothetical protein
MQEARTGVAKNFALPALQAICRRTPPGHGEATVIKDEQTMDFRSEILYFCPVRNLFPVKNFLFSFLHVR